MNQDYEYDDSGLVSSYLGLAILLPVALYVTYSRLFSQSTIKKYPCSCIHCGRNLIRQKKNTSIFLVAVLWTILSFLTRNILTLRLEYKSKYFNPYRILEVDSDASMQIIKKAFRRKVAKLNPDIAADEEKQEITEKLKEVIKAFNFLKEDKGEVFANETTYEVMAIPKWVVEKGYIVLLFYGIVIGVYLPYWAFRKWNQRVQKNRFGIYYSTIDAFYRKAEVYPKDYRNIINFVVSSRDLSERKWKSGNLCFLKQEIEERFGVPVKEPEKMNQAYFVLLDHFFRTGKADIEDLEFVQARCIGIANSLKEIAIQKGMLELLNTLFVFERMVIQAVFDPEFYLMQVPENDFEKVLLKNKKIRDFEDKKTLPRAEIKNLEAFVKNTELLESSSRKVAEGVYEVPKNSRITLKFELSRKEDEFVHSPFLRKEIKLVWTIFASVDGRILESTIMVPNVSEKRNFELVFDSASGQAQSNVVVYVKSGAYFDIDQEASLVIKYMK